MKILLLAPQPFFTERGTPIAIDLLLRAFSQRGDAVDVLTYPMGDDVSYEHVTIARIPAVPGIRDVGPGFSFRKVILDLFLLFAALGAARRKAYQVVHAVEESVFIALVLKLLFGLPYVYDMDSSLSQQMVERYPRLFRWIVPFLDFWEGLAIRQAVAVVPVCDALGQDIDRHKPRRMVVLRDISLLAAPQPGQAEELRRRLGIRGVLLMYVGNLEAYQGIDLLLESFALAWKRSAEADLVIIGGKPADIARYQGKARRLGIAARVHFVGPRPVEQLSAYLAQADILVSPRTRGKNTPMKVYSYLDSGKALLATNLPTHTQVITGQVAVLADPSPEPFSAGLQRLISDPALRGELGQAARRLVAERHTFAVLCDGLNGLYDSLRADLARPPAPGSGWLLSAWRSFYRPDR